MEDNISVAFDKVVLITLLDMYVWMSTEKTELDKNEVLAAIDQYRDEVGITDEIWETELKELLNVQ